jgi:CheY-like chemotaxis protein
MVGGTILVAEDDTQILQVLRRALEREGYDVLTARDGQEALDAAKEKKPGVVLSDVWMPRMDGVMFVNTLRDTLQNGYSPQVILMSAYDRPAHIEVDAFVPKPFDLMQLLDLVDNMFRRHRELEQAGPGAQGRSS